MNLIIFVKIHYFFKSLLMQLFLLILISFIVKKIIDEFLSLLLAKISEEIELTKYFTQFVTIFFHSRLKVI